MKLNIPQICIMYIIMVHIFTMEISYLHSWQFLQFSNWPHTHHLSNNNTDINNDVISWWHTPSRSGDTHKGWGFPSISYKGWPSHEHPLISYGISYPLQTLVPYSEEYNVSRHSACRKYLIWHYQNWSDISTTALHSKTLCPRHDIMSSVYDKDWKLSRHSFSFVNSVNFPLIMYSKFVWPNLFGRTDACFDRKMSCDWLLS